MTILVVLLGLLISHWLVPSAHFRSYAPLLRPVHWVRRRYPESDWAVTAAVVAGALLSALVTTLVAEALLGGLGWFLLALVVFVYTLGPRDLDRDVHTLLEGGHDARYLKVRRIMRLSRDAQAADGAAAILRAAEARWFGILFWFVVLGIPGALLYRLTRVSLHEMGLQPFQSAYLLRLRVVLDWPVLVLLLASAALVSDFDRVRDAWRRYRVGASSWRLDSAVLDQIAVETVDAQGQFEDGVRAGHGLARRMLLLWLVVLSLLLILGWLS